MTTHLSEDDLVLHYYGEMTGADESCVATHLVECSTCRESFQRLQRVLAVVDERALAGPELPEHFERTVWARLEPSLQRERTGWWSWFVLSPSRLAWLAAIVVLVTGAFVAGRLGSCPDDRRAAADDSATRVRERILLVDLGEHLEQSQMVLVELVSADPDGSVDISQERERAEELVSANRLYRQTAMSTGDNSIVDVLDELERVLVDVAASPEHVSSSALDEVRRRIESRNLLFKVRVVSSEVRQRQRSIVQERAGARAAS